MTQLEFDFSDIETLQHRVENLRDALLRIANLATWTSEGARAKQIAVGALLADNLTGGAGL